jgi:hypothetical protein
MTNSFRRYEIHLPLRFNDGSTVPDEFFGQVAVQLRKQFHAASFETSIIRGIWEHQDQIYRDELVRVFVDVPDTDENKAFFKEYKEHLKERFGQLDIWITSHTVEII